MSEEDKVDEYLEMAIAFGNPKRFSEVKDRLKKQVQDNKKFYPDDSDPLEELIDADDSIQE